MHPVYAAVITFVIPHEFQTVSHAVVDWANTMTDARELLLEEVKFKWLLSGLDIWVDMSKFHSDPKYATRYLAIGRAAKCPALKSCAIELQRRSAV